MFSRHVSHLSAIAAVVGGLSLGCSGAASQESQPLNGLRAPLSEKSPALSTDKLEALRLSAELQRSPESERAYLSAFPRSFAAFKETFATSGPTSLEPKYVEHMTLLEKLSARHQEEVVKIWLDACIGASWDADAIGMLQGQVTKFAAQHPDVFGAAMTKKSLSDQKSIVRFLADVENPDVNFEYQQAIVGLRSRKFNALARELETAQAQRELESKH